MPGAKAVCGSHVHCSQPTPHPPVSHVPTQTRTMGKKGPERERRNERGIEEQGKESFHVSEPQFPPLGKPRICIPSALTRVNEMSRVKGLAQHLAQLNLS